jgi:hypothetical protein
MNDWQAVAVLHVSDLSGDPRQLLAAYPLVGATSWRKGDLSPRRKPYFANGLRATLVDADSQAALHRGLDRHLTECAAFHSEVTKQGGRTFLDIGLMVPATHPLSLTFEAELLSALLVAGIVLTISAYPCSDELSNRGHC